jgi:hypothetical protein
MKHFIVKRYFLSLLLTAIICCSSIYAKAQTAAKPAEAKPAAAVPKTPTSLIDAFFKKYKEEGTGAAVDYIFGTNKLFDNNAGIAVLKVKLDSLRLSAGLYTGKELITQKNSGASLVLYSYLAKHENSPIRFTFIFYKAQNDWVLYRFKYDDQMDIELQDASKIIYKKTP